MKSLCALAAIPALILSLSRAAAAEGWSEDFAKAKETAAKENKDLLMDFTGSDWCGWCIKLDKEVFSKKVFQTTAPKYYVLVSLDYPQKTKQPDEIKEQNEKLQEEFKIQGFPTIVLADSKGRPYAKTGYQAGGPDKYLEHLSELRKVREARDENLKKAEAATGLEKAKLIHAAVKGIDAELTDSFYKKEIEQIIELDKDDVTGLKKESARRERYAALQEELQKLGNGKKFKEFEARIDQYIEDEKLTGARKQEMMLERLSVYGPDRLDEADKLLDAIVAVEPKSEFGERAASLKERVAQMKEQVAKSKEKQKDKAGKDGDKDGDEGAEDGDSEGEDEAKEKKGKPKKAKDE